MKNINQCNHELAMVKVEEMKITGDYIYPPVFEYRCVFCNASLFEVYGEKIIQLKGEK